MKVLLVQSHLGRHNLNYPLFPIGLCYIASVLTKHEVKILNLNLWDFDESSKMLEKEIKEFSPEVVGISIRNIDTTRIDDIFYHFKRTIRQTAKQIKKIDPRIKLLAGGPGFSIFSKKIMERVPEFDFGIYLDGEESTPELLDNFDNPEDVKGVYYRRNGAVHFSGDRKLPDFDSVPMARRDPNLIDIKQYFTDPDGGTNIGIQAKRGCIMNCVYCGYPFLSGNNLRLRSPEKVVDEIEYLIGLGIRYFSFVDNIFNVPVSHAREICEEIIKRNIKVKWSAWFEIKNTSEDLVLLCQKAGCEHFEFSPDGATDNTLDGLKKGISKKDLNNNLKLFKKIDGVKAGYNFFAMAPGMKLEDLITTLYYYFKIPIYLFGKASTCMSFIRIEPHSEIHEIAIREGILEKETDLLPADEKGLKELFYTKPSYRFIDFLIITFVNFTDGIVKPTVKFFLKIISKNKV